MTGRGSHEHVDTVVIGGSQSGLAVGYHLMRAGRPFVILDEHDRVGDAWRGRWDSLRLFTTAKYDGLPGMPFPAPRRSYPTKDEVADYLEVYAERFDLRVLTGVRVEQVTRRGQLFDVAAGERTFTAENVVVATGAAHTPRVPGFAGELDATILQLHSSEYRNPAQLRDGGVLVVGAGHSGAEIGLEVSQHHPTWLSGPDTGQEPTSAGSLPDRLLMPLMWLVASRVLTVGTSLGRKVRRHFLEPPRGIPLGRVRAQGHRRRRDRARPEGRGGPGRVPDARGRQDPGRRHGAVVHRVRA